MRRQHLVILTIFACLFIPIFSPMIIPVKAQEPITIRIGYLHTLAVDGAFWIMMEKGYFEALGLKVEPIRFGSGPPLMTAMAGKSIDIAIMGAVISNFPAQGVGKVFLINDIEFATAQIWCHPESGVKTLSDLKGKTIATVKGTTAHVFLHEALKSVGLDSNTDVNIVNMDMPSTTAAFISKAVNVAVVWCPFEVRIKESCPDAYQLANASMLFPQAAIIGGWVAENDFYKNHRDILIKIVQAWVPANDWIINKPEEAIPFIHKVAYSDIPISDLWVSYRAQLGYLARNWIELYKNGTVAYWIGKVEKTFVDIGILKNYVDPNNFFDASIYLEALDITTRAEKMLSDANNAILSAKKAGADTTNLEKSLNEAKALYEKGAYSEVIKIGEAIIKDAKALEEQALATARQLMYTQAGIIIVVVALVIIFAYLYWKRKKK